MNKYFTKGIQYMILSVTVFAVMNLIAKSLVHFSWSETVFYRSITTFFIVLFLAVRLRIPLLGTHRSLLLLRAACGTVAMGCFFGAMQVLPLTTTVTIRYLAPIFGAIMSIYFLKDKVKPIQWLFFLMAFSGVVLLKGFDARVSNTGLIIILISAVFTGAIYVIIQKIGKREHPYIIIGYFMFFASVVGALFTGTNWRMPQGSEWVALLSLGILGFFGQLYMTKALQEESTARVAPVKYLEAVFVFGLGWLWLGETYTWVPILGIVLIIVGMALNVIYGKNK